MKPLLTWLVKQLMLRSMRSTFAEVRWVTPLPELPRDRPLILYANHHSFYDGYLLWLIADHWQGRRPLMWMAEWDRMPIFAMVGTHPFPPDDARRRAATLRRTVRTFREDSSAALGYFPEGRLHPPEESVLHFDTSFMSRMDRLFPEKYWWPIGIHLTWRTSSKPVACVGGGDFHATVTGNEVDTLRKTLQTVREQSVTHGHLLLQGSKDANSRWNFGALRRLFARYL